VQVFWRCAIYDEAEGRGWCLSCGIDWVATNHVVLARLTRLTICIHLPVSHCDGEGLLRASRWKAAFHSQSLIPYKKITFRCRASTPGDKFQERV
jgi:hypothetical protein